MSQDSRALDSPDVSGAEATASANDARAVERRAALSRFWVAVKRLPAYARLTAALVRDAEVPHRARAMLLAGGAYLVSPIDLIPGVIPVAGQLDDMYVVLVAIRQALRMSPPGIADRYLSRFELTSETIDSDLAAIRTLVCIGVSDGARWGLRRIGRLGSRIRMVIEQRQGGNA